MINLFISLNKLQTASSSSSSKMQHHVVSTCAATLKLSTFIFFLFFKGSFCLDPSYEACVPIHCHDGTKVSFPFFIGSSQRSFCGYSGFEVQCSSSGSLVMRISGNDYLVNDINYNINSMRLVNSQNITCPSAVRNMTLDPQLFRLDKVSTRELVFLMNCSNDLPQNLARYRIGSCDPARQLVMLTNDRNLGIGKELCSHAVVVPVEIHGGEGRSEVVDGGNYAELMMRGFTTWWFEPDCDTCEGSGGRCGRTTDSRFQCFCPHGPHTRSCPFGRKKKPVILITAFTAGITLFLVIFLCFIMKHKWIRKTKIHVNVENFLKNHEFMAPKRYSYSQVKKMTNSFEIKLGQGGFGSVYKGVLSDENSVAVKVLSDLKGNDEDFINEVASVGRTSHVNIVTLVGFCFESRQKALIYEFMPNGSLERFIYDQASSNNCQLGWEKLHQIAIGIARGLEYLHSGCNTRILHFDIKPHNILLDQDLCPKISDFGLAKLFPDKESMISMSCMRGTPGYIAPELFSRSFGQVSHKSDVYSYGMMILEMVGGRRNIQVEDDHTSEIYFPHWIYKKIEFCEEQLGLHGIVSNEENEMARKMIIVGLWCIQTNPLSRPTITEALEMLEGGLTSIEIPPKPYLSSPSRSFGTSSTN